MSRSAPKRMKEKTIKRKKSSGKFGKFIIIVIIALAGILVYKYVNEYKMKEDGNVVENERNPVIYYTEDNGPKKILSDEENIFNTNLEITSKEECSVFIKKDGEEFSKEDTTILVDEGTYEITVKTKGGKKSTTKTLQIDKTPPDVKITRNSPKSYTITFADVNDIGTAKLIKLDASTGKTIKETNLMKDELQSSIEIKEKGIYSLEVTDKIGNLFVGNTEFEIE